MSKTHLLKLNCSCKNKKIVAYLSSHDCPEYKSLYSASIICSECKIQGSSGFKFECYMDDCLNLRNDNDFSCYHCLYKHFGDKHLLCKACNPNGIGICKECYNDTSQSQRKCNQHCELKILKLSTGNNCLDEFIYKTQQNSRGLIDWLDWIDYKQFSDITFLAEGGFANVYLAEWKEGPPSQYQCWYVPIGRNRNTNTKVVLKSLKNSKNMTKEFLNELDTHHKCLGGLHNSLRCYGVTFIPEQNEYALVLKYAQNGNIRQYIQKENENLTWYRRVELLEGIVDNLKHIHSKNFIHGDLHSGNVLKGKLVLEGYISDLGMSRPVDDSKPVNGSYGIMPYMAPELFRNQPYTKAADIYAIGIIMAEIASGGEYPFGDRSHDVYLQLDICDGLRPKISYAIPKSWKDLMEKCWHQDPKKRPDVKQLGIQLRKIRRRGAKWIKEDIDKDELAASTRKLNKTDIRKQNLHSGAIYTSRLIPCLSNTSTVHSNDDLFASS